MKLEILYNGSVIGSLSAGQSAIIPKGNKFVSDIVIRAVAEETVSLISFTIDGNTYYSPEGWTWYEWAADTTYNTDGVGCAGEEGMIYAPNGKFLFEGEGYTVDDATSDAIVRGNETIIANHDYYSMIGAF